VPITTAHGVATPARLPMPCHQRMPMQRYGMARGALGPGPAGP
jgi:hypothetical protein